LYNTSVYQYLSLSLRAEVNIIVNQAYPEGYENAINEYYGQAGNGGCTITVTHTGILDPSAPGSPPGTADEGGSTGSTGGGMAPPEAQPEKRLIETL
jgi:hypothetical protein